MAETHTSMVVELLDLHLDNGKLRSWKDLPVGVLSEIYTRTNSVDRYAFRLVCKSCQPAHALKTPCLQLPLNNAEYYHSPYLLFRNKLYHPIFGTCHSVDMLPDKPGAIVNVAKDGWLLITYKKNEIFFYNPITKITVQLPGLKHTGGLRSMWFSAPPASKGWLVIAAKTNFDKETFVYSIRDGEEDWSFCEFTPTTELEESFKLSHCNAVIHKGLYNFLGKQAHVLTHDPRKRKFYFCKVSRSISQDFKAYGGQGYMLESDGKLLAVFVKCDGSLIRICQWNVFRKEWEIRDSLRNKMLFVSPMAFMSETTDIKGASNKIYFPRFVDDQLLFYSLSTKRYHTFKGGSYGDFNVEGSKRYADSIWFKPVA